MRIKVRPCIAFILCTIIAGQLLRLVPLIQKPLEIDEAWTLYFARVYTFRQLLFVSPVPNDIHPGLYYITIKLLLTLTDNLLALRIASAFIPQAAGVIVFIAWGLKRKLNHLFLLIAAAAVSFSPFLIFYAWQLRMYGLVALWTSALGIFLFEYLFLGKKEKFLSWMIPIFFLSQATHIAGYPLTFSIVLTVMGLDYISTKSFIKVLAKHKRWLGLTVFATLITLLPYYPFRFAGLFPRASWVPIPSAETAIRIFPLTTLGLDYLINSQQYVPAWGWQLVMPLGLVFALLVAYVYAMRHDTKTLLLPLLMIFLIPILALVFSYLAPAINKWRFFYKIIPPVSIFLPRFFLSQAIFLHVFIATGIYRLFVGHVSLQKPLALAMICFFAVAWTQTHRSITITSTTERELDLDGDAMLTQINPNRTVFYPGYTALYSINPKYRLQLRDVIRLFDHSQAFEDMIKGNSTIFSCATAAGDEHQFTLILDRNIPTFFQSFESTLGVFTRQNCIKHEGGSSHAVIFSCRCREAL